MFLVIFALCAEIPLIALFLLFIAYDIFRIFHIISIIKYNMKSYAMAAKFSNIKYSVVAFFKANQIRIIIVAGFVLLAFVTGIFSAVKFIGGEISLAYSDFGIKEFANGNSGTTAMFFERFASCGVVIVVLSVCSLTAVLFPIGVVFLVYRSFLLGLNIAFVVVLYGISGIITGILIIFPLQLIMLLLMLWFFILARDKCIAKGKYGKKRGMGVFVLMLIFLLALTLVNLAETILLVISSSRVILVI